MSRLRQVSMGGAMTAMLLAWASGGEAHKQGESPFGFNDAVFPILRDRCGQCHVSGGVAPMSLMTFDDAVPWGESMRLELMAGHMPPWDAETGMGRLRHSGGLTARELNVLLTWASGDTPRGDPARMPPPVVRQTGWPLGPPDAVLRLPEVTLDPATAERTETFTVPSPFEGDARLRAVDLRPGTAAIVRSATVTAPGGQVLALWQPGGGAEALPDGRAFRLPAGATLSVRVRYRKTWAHERMPMTDESAIGLYLASGAGADVTAVDLAPGVTVLDRPLILHAVAPAPNHASAAVRISATLPGRAPSTLIAFHVRPWWVRRYWFEEPLTLPRGTRLEVTGAAGGDAQASRLLLDVSEAR